MSSSSSGGDDSATISFALEPQSNGYPALLDDALRSALAAAAQGGDKTQGFFDALNATADFWGLMADGTITFAPGVDPQGRPVLMASSGNVQLRLEGVYTGPPGGLPPGDTSTVVGTLTVATRNTTTQASKILAVAARVASMPVYLPLTSDLFHQLLPPIYANAKTLLTSLAGKLRAAARVEAPEVDPQAETDEVVEAQDEVLEDVGADGLRFLSIEWSSVGLDVAGLAPLVAIPMIVEFLGHAMQHSLVVVNLTGEEFAVGMDLLHGKTACSPASATLPGVVAAPDPLNPGAEVSYAYEAYYQLINTSDLGAIGHVVTLTPAGGGPVARAVTAIPWAGDNAIWVGASDLPDAALYDSQSAPDGRLSATATFGAYKVTHTINKLGGETDGDYFYCSLLLIEPA